MSEHAGRFWRLKDEKKIKPIIVDTVQCDHISPLVTMFASAVFKFTAYSRGELVLPKQIAQGLTRIYAAELETKVRSSPIAQLRNVIIL